MLLSEDINDFCFIDSETRPMPGTPEMYQDVTKCGAYAYAPHAETILWSFAIGEQPAQIVEADCFGFHDLKWMKFSEEFREFYKRAAAGEAWFVAWNMNFDRLVWNTQPSFPQLRIDMTLDAMAQGAASNLPPGLDGAGKILGIGGKQADGKDLIKLFCNTEGPQPVDAPDEWARFKSYALEDTEQLRGVFQATRHLSATEWQEYWVSERINDRGMSIDLEFVERAAAIAAADRKRTNSMLPGLTGGAIKTIHQHVAIANWLYDNVTTTEARDLLVKSYAEGEEDDYVPAKLSAERPRIEALTAYYGKREDEMDGLTDGEINIVELAELRQFGASSSPKKFEKMLAQHVDGRLYGQYVFNGAQQTGRYSSKGVQVHNLPRKSLAEREEAAMELVNELDL